MKGGLRQSMAWLHTWTGLVLGWLLYAIFVTGTSAYFQEETTQWMTPEIGSIAVDSDKSYAAAADWLARKAPGATEWSIYRAGQRAPGLQLYWANGPDAPADAPTEARLDRQGREVTARDTRGGYFLYRFHYDLHYINWYWARWLVGIAAIAMLVAILSGIVTHKKIIADYFMLRLGKGQRSWLDVHNASSVLFLPFILMITYTGLVSLATHYMPWGIAANYADTDKFYAAAFPYPDPPEKSGPAPLAPIGPMVAAAEHQWGTAAGGVRILNPGDRSAQVIVSSGVDNSLSARPRSLTFDGVTGRVVGRHDPSGAATTTEGVMIGLHAGRYARPVLRWLYLLSGLAGCVMVASGLILWTVKRRTRLADPDKPHFGFRLVEKLNIGAIVGLPLGIAVYFLANRLLPVALAGRADHEIDSLFLAWLAVFVWAAVRPPQRAWAETTAATAALFAAVPVVNALTTDRGLFASLAAGEWIFAGFDLAMLVLAAGFWAAHRRIVRRAAEETPRRRRRDAAPA
ncbi:peptidase [Sphingopyxis macrogoltabida]|uniref:Peptidase n=2 Tax=Sphingopyxis macrogoltabida TaxID=33050 RepID=A0A0N9UGF6_SPHMC|nr:peptidase [Sphingopyxis macrogoltabida]